MYVTLGPNEVAYPCNLSTREAKVGPEDHFIPRPPKKSYTRSYVCLTPIRYPGGGSRKPALIIIPNLRLAWAI